MAQALFVYPFLKQPKDSNCFSAGGRGSDAYIEAASQVYKQGAPVYRDAGKVKVSVVTSNKISAGGIEGLANQDATGVTDTPAPITTFRAGDQWAMNFKPPSGSELTAAALLNTFVNFDVYNPSTGVYYLVANNVSTDDAKPGGWIRGIYVQGEGFTQAQDAIGATNGLVLVELAPGAGIV
jgi:hypothetical protein